MNINKKILIAINGTYLPSHSANWIECESTYIPKLREKGFDVFILLSDPDQKEEYKIKGNFFITKNSDEKDGLYFKGIHYISKYILSETGYDYYLNVDSDTFIHPDRFEQWFQEIYNSSKNKDYIGGCIPYKGWNPYLPHQELITEPNFYASGAITFLSRKSLQILLDLYSPETYTYSITCTADKFIGKLLFDHGIFLLHDSRLNFESPFNRIIYDPHNLGTPFIGEKNSFLVAQHYCNGHMQEIMEKLKL